MSPGSLVTTTCPVLRAQITTWASTISAIAVSANKSPTAVASGPLTGIRSVPACDRSDPVRSAARVEGDAVHAALFLPVGRLPAPFFPAFFSRMEKRIRPFALLVRHGYTGSPRRVVQHRPPPLRVEQSNANGMLDEPGHARRLSRSDQFADRMNLIVRQSDGNPVGCHSEKPYYETKAGSACTSRLRSALPPPPPAPPLPGKIRRGVDNSPSPYPSL